jgi:two-component system response regulator NreC
MPSRSRRNQAQIGSAHLRLVPRRDAALPTASERTIRVVLADDRALMRRNLRLLLHDEEGVEVIAEAADLVAVACQLHAHRPDVLVLDLGMSNGSSIEAVGRLREQESSTQIVVLTMNDSPVLVQMALDAGAIGFVLKELADAELAPAVRSAADGREYLSPGVAGRLESLRRSLGRGS